MSPRGRLVAFPVAGLTAALLWTSFGTFSTASGQEKPAEIMRAHQGKRAPTFERPVYLLVLGGDARGGNPTHTRTDSIHVVAVDPTSLRATIVGIPRDSYVDIPGRGKDKINSANRFGGPTLTIQTVEKLSGCDFDYYLLTSFEGFRKVVNEFGGIRFTVPRGGLSDDKARANFAAGAQYFSGAEALAWSRSRYARPRGDLDRSLAQGQLMVGALREARKDFADDPGSLLRNLGALRRNLRMDVPLAEGLRLGLLALQIKPRNVTNIVADGTTGSAGGASVVFISDKGRSQLFNVCVDAVLD